MSGMDLMKGLSDIDEELVMKPRKSVPLGRNFLSCILAANIGRLVPGSPMAELAVSALAFFGLYALDSWRLNRRRRKKLLIEPEE